MLLTIEKLVYGGDGLARADADASGRSLAVFVPFVLPGEKVEAEVRQAKGSFSRVAGASIVEPSSERVIPRCPYFQRCGGCHYQHIAYDQQIAIKAEILRETLRRVSKIDLATEIVLHRSPPWNYRNRARLRIRTTPKFALGYFKFGSHDFLAVDECPISSPLLNRVIGRMMEGGGFGCPQGVAEIELLANAEDTEVLAWAFCGQDIDAKKLRTWASALLAEIAEINGVSFFPLRQKSEGRPRRQRSHEHVRDVGDDEQNVELKVIASSGETSIPYRVGKIEYRVSAGAFFQVNRFLIGDLVATVTGHAEGVVAADLYAGGGLFSAALAQKFRHIFSVEASLTSLYDFRHNVPANVKAISARTEDFLQAELLKPGALRGRPDLIVLDPPRSGVGRNATGALVNWGAPMIRYVSCDPSTLARDLAPLVAAGYRIEEAHLFDLFPETFHIETVMLLAR